MTWPLESLPSLFLNSSEYGLVGLLCIFGRAHLVHTGLEWVLCCVFFLLQDLCVLYSPARQSDPGITLFSFPGMVLHVKVISTLWVSEAQQNSWLKPHVWVPAQPLICLSFNPGVMSCTSPKKCRGGGKHSILYVCILCYLSFSPSQVSTICQILL